MTDASGALGTELPNPTGVSSLADLAYELRLLKIHAGDPSVRDVAKSSRVPSSTVQDALHGSRGLPSLANVIALVRALDPHGNDEPWRAAWVRVRSAQRGLRGRSAAARSTPAQTAPSFQPTRPSAPRAASDEGDRSARQLRSGSPITFPILDLDSDSTTFTTLAPARIGVVNRQEAVRLVETLSVPDVIAQLADMSRLDAAQLLNEISPDRAAAILASMNERIAAELLSKMRSPTAVRVITAMSLVPAATILQALPLSESGRILTALDPARASAILNATVDGGIRLLTEAKFDSATGGRLLAAMPVAVIQRLIDGDTGSQLRVVGWLVEGPPGLATRVLAMIPPMQAVTWLNRLQLDELAKLVEGLPDDLLRSVLAHVPTEAMRAFLKALGENRLVQLLAGTSRNTVRAWLPQLRGGFINGENYTRLMAAIEKA